MNCAWMVVLYEVEPCWRKWVTGRCQRTIQSLSQFSFVILRDWGIKEPVQTPLPTEHLAGPCLTFYVTSGDQTQAALLLLRQVFHPMCTQAFCLSSFFFPPLCPSISLQALPKLLLPGSPRRNRDTGPGDGNILMCTQRHLLTASRPKPEPLFPPVFPSECQSTTNSDLALSHTSLFSPIKVPLQMK